MACERLQINANGSRGLRLRFIGDDQETGGSYQLSFVSLDGDQGSPLSCDNSGCSVDSRRWSATLLSTSWVRFDARGLPKGLPATRMAQGRCCWHLRRSANRKHKYSVGGVRPVVSHESEEPRRSNTPGSFLGKHSRHPRQSPLIGEGGRRSASSRPAALSVSEGPLGIPVLFCLWSAERGSSSHAPVL